MNAPAAFHRESRCEHGFTAGFCSLRGCVHAEKPAKYLTLSSPPAPLETTSQSDFVKQCIHNAEVRKLRAFACARRWLRHG